MGDLEILQEGDELYVDSRLIAERLGLQHRNFLETLDSYETQIQSAFGVLRFQTAKPIGPQGGRPSRYALLTEDQATFIMTLSRNTPEVVECKIDLVQAFSKAKKLLQKREQQSPRHLPYWYKRINLAMSDTENPLQSGYFCAYEQMMTFFSQLETRLGYVMPDYDPVTGEYLIPDISIGRRFNSFLRDEAEIPTQARREFLGSGEPIDFRQPGNRKGGYFGGGKHWQEIKQYNHVYPPDSHGENQVQQANSYPNRYLSIFRYFLEEYWIPDVCVSYLDQRDPNGVRYLQSAINDLPLSGKQSLAGTLIGKLIRSLPESA